MALIKLGLEQPQVGNIEQRLSAPPQLENPSNPLNSAAAWAWISSHHQESSAGEWVNPSTAMRIASVYSCVRVLAESIGSLTLNLFKRTSGGRQIAYDHQLYTLLAVAPNEAMVSQTFWEAAVSSVCLFGNFYAEIKRDSKGNITGLWPLLASQTEPVRLADGSIAYKTGGNEPESGEQAQRVIAGQNVFHLMLNSLDGLRGLSPIQMTRETLGRALALDKFSSRFFANFATPQLALINKSERRLSPEAKFDAKADWQKISTGYKQHQIAVLDNDYDIKQLTIPQDSAQFIETAQLSRSEICGIFRVPEHFIGSLERITNSNLETMNRQFLTQTLRPWLSRIEATIVSKLLPRQVGQPMYTVEWDTSDFTRGDSAAQTAALTSGTNQGWLSVNEARAELGLNPIGPEGDVYRCPAQLINAKLLLTQTGPEAEPLPQPVVDGASDKVATDKVPTAAERQALKQYRTAFLSLAIDAVRRTAAGENVTRAFGPLVESIAETVQSEDEQRIVEVLKGVESRAAQFTAANAEDAGAQTLQYIVRKMVFGAHEDAAKAALSEV